MRYNAPHPSGLDVYRSSSIAKGMPMGRSSSCSHRNGIIPSGMLRAPPRYSGGKAHRKFAWRDLQAKQTTMALLHSTAQLERDCSQTPSGPASRDLDRAEDYLRSQLPALGCNTRAVVLAVDKLRSLLPAHSVSRRRHRRGPAHRVGPGACPVGRVLSMELAIDLRSPDLLVQDSLNSGAAVFDVKAWLEPIIPRRECCRSDS